MFNWAHWWDELVQEMILLPRKPRQGKYCGTKGLNWELKSLWHSMQPVCGSGTDAVKSLCSHRGHLHLSVEVGNNGFHPVASWISAVPVERSLEVAGGDLPKAWLCVNATLCHLLSCSLHRGITSSSANMKLQKLEQYP